MVLYLYSAFLVLMTTQGALQNSFTFTHIHTHIHTVHLLAALLLFYDSQFRVQHLAQRHFGMQMGKTGDRTTDLQVGGQRLYPSATAAHTFQLNVFHQKQITSLILPESFSLSFHLRAGDNRCSS